VNESLKSPDLLAAFSRMGFDATPQSRQELADFLQAEATNWPPILKAAGVKAD
jgi:tripartite-type tricarboxylate transporter receptor subunit TctC